MCSYVHSNKKDNSFTPPKCYIIILFIKSFDIFLTLELHILRVQNLKEEDKCRFIPLARAAEPPCWPRWWRGAAAAWPAAAARSCRTPGPGPASAGAAAASRGTAATRWGGGHTFTDFYIFSNIFLYFRYI